MTATREVTRRTTTLPTTLSAITINVAFLQEIKEASEELWKLLGKIQELRARPISIHMHPRQVVDLLEQLQDQLALYFTLEEYYGYFEDPVEVDPRLSERAHALRMEHQTLYLEICAIVERAERLLDQRKLASLTRHIVLRFGAFNEQLRAHEAHEDELILESLEDDIGVGD